ncbi:MAG TPA: transposase [Terriglobales bacterium]
MAAPRRGNTGLGTYFITADTFQRHSLFQSERMAELFLEVVFHYRSQQKYLLHEFVIMPDHFHLLITPALTLERALQVIKGGFSFRAKRELGFGREIWEKSFHDHRVRGWEEYCAFRRYIHLNPVKKGLVTRAEEYAYSSARPGVKLDDVPQRLKPRDSVAVYSQR